MSELLLTLGHNSSAILVEDGEIVCGYENERITGAKSDSRFPVEAMNYMSLRGDLRLKDVSRVYATHWAPNGRLSSMGAKYWNPTYFENQSIRSLSVDQSHHDCHMSAAMLYAGKMFPYGDDAYCLVIDGFGIMGEHLSVYSLPDSDPNHAKLLRRVRGYDTSLGLWYQYATAFMGMKMHEDEYKLLGYEAHVDSQQAYEIMPHVEHKVQLWLDSMERLKYKSEFDPLFELAALDNVRKTIFSHLADVCGRIGVTDPTSFDGRVKLSFYVQQVLEGVVASLIGNYPIKNVLLSGGVFQNVKLNLTVVEQVPGQVCAMPLCGDQGNALGLYHLDNTNFEIGDRALLWGKRTLIDVGNVPNLHYCRSEDMVAVMAQNLIAQCGFVNIVRDEMEFGPRALCNTSTIARPDMQTVDAINYMNDRNTVMPMAPVMSQDTFDMEFKHSEQLWKCEEHMIVALPYRSGRASAFYPGAAHSYTWPEPRRTGRPQVARPNDWLMHKLLEPHGMLINTSFNYHGKPIALDMEHVVSNHMLQYQRDPRIHTIVLCND